MATSSSLSFPQNYKITAIMYSAHFLRFWKIYNVLVGLLKISEAGNEKNQPGMLRFSILFYAAFLSFRFNI